ncbi:hypothetical protein FOZ60_009574 [Perkinsus olseni]|uniref:Uncharacterized protein n=1 Tax=Perkinsus olseni TaxID=32597 RepID=A0A7J6NH17_PEROL|nr:hypothetical protein FOZ60_009574 [Perkinsus olseni]
MCWAHTQIFKAIFACRASHYLSEVEAVILALQWDLHGARIALLAAIRGRLLPRRAASSGDVVDHSVSSYNALDTKNSVHEYDSSDTPSGFLRWSRPAVKRRSHFQNLLECLKASRGKNALRHMATVALLFGLLLAFILWCTWAILTITYRPSSVLEIVVDKVSMNQVWCGSVTLESKMKYCAAGTVDLRIRNRLWIDLAIVRADVSPFDVCNSRNNPLSAGFLQVGGTVVKAMSDDVYTVPVTLTSLIPGDHWRPSVCNCVLRLDLDTLGGRSYDVDYGILQVPNFTVPHLPS